MEEEVAEKKVTHEKKEEKMSGWKRGRVANGGGLLFPVVFGGLVDVV